MNQGRGDHAPFLHGIEDERERIQRPLELAEGNRERAASMLGMSRTTLWRRMRAAESSTEA